MRRGFVPIALWTLLFLTALTMTSIMAVRSSFDRHPDEIHHFEAAKYYRDHAEPPVIGDPAVRSSYSVWGVSYLNYHWLEYLYLGKFSSIALQFGVEQLTATRFGNVTLLALLGIIFGFAARTRPGSLIIGAFVLTTPQVWYVFSYVNNDAFALFFAFLAAGQIAVPNSRLNRFLDGGSITGGILFGVFAGILLIVKPNYWSFLVFSAAWLIYRHRITYSLAKRFVLIASIALLILGVRIGLDFKVNGETNFVGFSYLNKFAGEIESGSKLKAYQESIVDPEFRPSTIESDLGNSYPEINMRERGIGLFEMLFAKGWVETSFKSFFGYYGYVRIPSSTNYYFWMLAIWLAFAAYITAIAVRRRDRDVTLPFLITAFGCFLTVGVSVVLSWVYAFQPQGRYLFPLLPMLGVFLFTVRRSVRTSVIYLFFIMTFLLSAYSYYRWGLRLIGIEL